MLLSEKIKALVLQVTKAEKEGQFISIGRTLTFESEYDVEGCMQVLDDLIVKPDNVMRYLKMKYKPDFIETGVLFHNQKCIQFALIDPIHKELRIYIKNSEPHKLITDVQYIITLLKDNNYSHNSSIRFKIDNIQIVPQELINYLEALKIWKMQMPKHNIELANAILYKYPTLEIISLCKKRSIKRKLLKLYVQRGLIKWEELRKVINIKDFSEENIKKVCKLIRFDAEARGVPHSAFTTCLSIKC